MWHNVLNFFGFEVDKDMVNQEKTEQKNEKQRIVSIHKNKEFKVIIYHPKSFNEVKTIVDDLKLRKPVIVNLEEVKKELSRRIIDFVSGAVFALDGNIQKVGEAVILFTPSNIIIDGEIIKKEINNNI